MLARLKEPFEALRGANGAFIAAPHVHYEACWLRDQLYSTFVYFFTKEEQKFKQGMWAVFDIFHKHRGKMKRIIRRPPRNGHEFIHAKYDPITLREVVDDWGHHQLDAIGLFLFLVGLAHKNGISLVRGKADKVILNLLVLYLAAVRYAELPDNGMWEEAMEVHTSSIGAVTKGLVLQKEVGLVKVPERLITKGRNALDILLPNESPTRDVDMAQLSLIWPYDIVTPAIRNEILLRTERKLVQKHGLNRYWGDEFYRSRVTGISGQWPMGFFWLSIIESDFGNHEAAQKWFDRGVSEMTPDGIPELYTDDTPNEHSPLAWAHALAIIAYIKLDSTKKNAVS